jgi:hypothetical protein
MEAAGGEEPALLGDLREQLLSELAKLTDKRQNLGRSWRRWGRS